MKMTNLQRKEIVAVRDGLIDLTQRFCKIPDAGLPLHEVSTPLTKALSYLDVILNGEWPAGGFEE